MMRNHQKGFTLMEMLIVVAIISVLIAIAVPTFQTQVERSREATDLANARIMYSEVIAEAAQGASRGPFVRVVTLKQKRNDWQTAGTISIGGVQQGDGEHWKGVPAANGTCKVSYDDKHGVVFDWNGMAPTDYFTEMKNASDFNIEIIQRQVQLNNGCFGFLIVNPDGTMTFRASYEDDSLGMTGWPENAVAGMMTHNGVDFVFYMIETGESEEWTYGTNPDPD